MGFFSDLKDDLSQAVNELLPEEELQSETKEEKAEKVEAEGISLDEMLANIDNIEISQESNDAEEAEKTDMPASEEVGATEDKADMDIDIDIPGTDYEPEVAYGQVVEEAEAEKEIKISKEETVEKGAGFSMESMENRVAIDETSVITGGMTIKGDISSQGSLDVIGTVCGNIDILGKLNISGHIEGNSKAAEIYAEEAKINGEIVSEGSVKIGASTVIVGNITATSAAIAGAVKGDIDVKGPVILDASAIVYGNIKSKSVQINNGAVIEGMCSQCYADVSPTSFFEDYKMETRKNNK